MIPNRADNIQLIYQLTSLSIRISIIMCANYLTWILMKVSKKFRENFLLGSSRGLKIRSFALDLY